MQPDNSPIGSVIRNIDRILISYRSGIVVKVVPKDTSIFMSFGTTSENPLKYKYLYRQFSALAVQTPFARILSAPLMNWISEISRLYNKGNLCNIQSTITYIIRNRNFLGQTFVVLLHRIYSKR